jgi:predicted signal transduction protein with EAL and GGDEF domain
VKVAIDDFGTGYSSLGYLRKFPLDALKIDQSFIRQFSTVDEDTAIVTAVIGMAKGLKLQVIAEGVETKEELAFLQAHECDAAQGYYFSRPVAPEQFVKLLETGIPKSGHTLWPGAAAAAAVAVAAFPASALLATVEQAKASPERAVVYIGQAGEEKPSISSGETAVLSSGSKPCRPA